MIQKLRFWKVEVVFLKKVKIFFSPKAFHVKYTTLSKPLQSKIYHVLYDWIT